MSNRQSRFVDVDVLRDLMERLLVGAGCTPLVAREVATVFWEADLRGNPMQGLDHMPTLLRCLKSGIIRPRGAPAIVKEGPAYAIVDGNRGPGPLTGMFAADLAARKAKSAGSCMVAAVDTGDIYMVGYYVERIAKAGCIGIVASNSGPYARAAGGVDRALGTNPIGFGIPRPGEDPVVVDFATSALSASRVRHALELGQPLPPNSAVSPDGSFTLDPQKAFDGAFDTFGAARGFGLSLAVALLSGPLIACSVGNAMTGMGWKVTAETRGIRKGNIFMAIDPGAFGDPAEFRQSVGRYLDRIKSSKALTHKVIHSPGEGSQARRAECLRTRRVPIYEFVWRNTTDLAR